MATPTTDRDTILRVIDAWPLQEQVTLAQAILTRAAARNTAPQRPGWRQMAGLASTEQLPPSDDAIAQWFGEHRLEQYG